MKAVAWESGFRSFGLMLPRLLLAHDLMSRMICFLLGWGAFLGALSPASAQELEGLPLEVRVTDQTKRIEKEKFHNAKYGRGELEKFENSFNAELKNSGLEGPIEGLKLRLVPFYIPFDFEGKRVGYRTGKVQVQENITLQPNESRRVEFAPEGFETGESRKETATTITTFHIGDEYTGVVLEIYHSGKLIGRRFDGPAGLRRAYEEWFEKDSQNAGKPAAEKTAPAGPSDSGKLNPAP